MGGEGAVMTTLDGVTKKPVEQSAKRQAVAETGALVAFAEDPAAWQRLRAQPELINLAVEEILRWTSPPAHLMRTALTDLYLVKARDSCGRPSRRVDTFR